ncbi:MAG: hypothetical protein CMH57_02150 [Myxococcales bacterium]|nr:hypothetical protein [Myxococcales bacterium]
MCKVYDMERPRLGARRTITVAGEFTRGRLGRFAVSCPSPEPTDEPQGATEAPLGAEATLSGVFKELSSAADRTLTALDRVACTTAHPGQDARSPIRTLNRYALSERYLQSAVLATLEATPAVLIRMTA